MFSVLMSVSREITSPFQVGKFVVLRLYLQEYQVIEISLAASPYTNGNLSLSHPMAPYPIPLS